MSEEPARPNAPEELPYRIELWHEHSNKNEVERVLARAVSAHLARAIFLAAKEEYPERRITLRQGDRTLADSST